MSMAGVPAAFDRFSSSSAEYDCHNALLDFIGPSTSRIFHWAGCRVMSMTPLMELTEAKVPGCRNARTKEPCPPIDMPMTPRFGSTGKARSTYGINSRTKKLSMRFFFR